MDSSILHTRIGGVPVIVLTAVGAGLVAVLLAFRGRPSSSGGRTSTALDMLAPSSAEAFGTLQQQNVDIGNALSALASGTQGVQDNLNQIGSTLTGQLTSANTELSQSAYQNQAYYENLLRWVEADHHPALDSTTTPAPAGVAR